MSVLHYAITQHGQPFPGMAVSPHGGRLAKTGTLPATGTSSAPIAIPRPADQIDTVATFRVHGTAPVAIAISAPNQPDPVATAAHAAEDAGIRIIVTATTGPITVPVPGGGKFSIIEAAALS